LRRCAKRTTSATSIMMSRAASLLETFIDDAEKRVWFLYEASRKGDPTGH
jgi:hypothetical protein